MQLQNTSRLREMNLVIILRVSRDSHCWYRSERSSTLPASELQLEPAGDLVGLVCADASREGGRCSWPSSRRPSSSSACCWRRHRSSSSRNLRSLNYRGRERHNVMFCPRFWGTRTHMLTHTQACMHTLTDSSGTDNMCVSFFCASCTV